MKNRKMLNIIIAPDSFKGSLTATEAAEAIKQGVEDAAAENGYSVTTTLLPMSDGGEGMADAFAAATRGNLVHVEVNDALMRRHDAVYCLKDNTAYIEVAQAVGLTLIEPEQRNPMCATSYGVGELLADALHRGAQHMVVGLGGTATSDCGIGMLRALVQLLGKRDEHIDEVLNRHFHNITITLAADVTAPLCGPTGAAYTFAEQKGATPTMLPQLEQRARRFAEASARHFGFDRSGDNGAGAAGGLGYAFLQYFGASMRSGAELLMECQQMDRLLATADWLVTGEGKSDRQTLMGKLPYRLLKHALQQNVKVALLSGQTTEVEALKAAGFTDILAATPSQLSLVEALQPEVAKANLSKAAKRWFNSQTTKHL